MNKKLLLSVVLTGLLAGAAWAAQGVGRPGGLTLSNFQFGPVNRWSFSHLREVLPTANIERGSQVMPLERGEGYVDDLAVTLEGREQNIDEIAESHYLDGVLVLKDGHIVFEKYWGHLTPARPHLMNSVSKSIVGLVAGRLAADGVLDLDKPVSHYVPALKDSGWGPDPVRLVLDMRDGSDYTEDYVDFGSTFRLQDCAVGWTDADYCPADGPRGGYAFFPTIGRDEAKAGKTGYRSGSTDVVGWVLEAAAGRPLAELISEYVWKPMGAEFDANITVDSSGFALADHGMSSTLRDLGRVGQMILDDGKALGQQVVPKAFMDDLMGQPGDPDYPYGKNEGFGHYYRSFWWGRVSETQRDVAGYGIHGQTIRVTPKDGLVLVIYSTWPLADGLPGQDMWWPLDYLMDAIEQKFR